jgi:hypothetical protein
MPFTPEQRAKALATRQANKAKRDAKKAAKLVSVSGVSDEGMEALKAKVRDLEAKLSAANESRSEAEKSALLAAESQGFVPNSGAEEVPTGRTVKVKKFQEWKSHGYKDNGDEIVTPVFKQVAEPTYFYRINMAPCGGSKLVINGTDYFHGATYEFDIDTLRAVKDIVFRTWSHDRDIHGSDENFYRAKNKDINPLNRLSARGM